MRFNDFQRLERTYKDKAEEARLEMTNAIKERDLVFTEIKAQRVGVIEVKNVHSKKSGERDEIILLLNALQNALTDKRVVFYNVTDSQRKSLDELEEQIKSNKEGVKQSEKKLINKETVLSELKENELKSKQLHTENTIFENTLQEKKNLLAQIESENKRTEKKNKQDAKANLDFAEALKKKEKKQNKKEELLNEFKRDLRKEKREIRT